MKKSIHPLIQQFIDENKMNSNRIHLHDVKKDLKRLHKQVGKETGLTLTQLHHIFAKRFGYESWQSFASCVKFIGNDYIINTIKKKYPNGTGGKLSNNYPGLYYCSLEDFLYVYKAQRIMSIAEAKDVARFFGVKLETIDLHSKERPAKFMKIAEEYGGKNLNIVDFERSSDVVYYGNENGTTLEPRVVLTSVYGKYTLGGEVFALIGMWAMYEALGGNSRYESFFKKIVDFYGSQEKADEKIRLISAMMGYQLACIWEEKDGKNWWYCDAYICDGCNFYSDENCKILPYIKDVMYGEKGLIFGYHDILREASRDKKFRYNSLQYILPLAFGDDYSCEKIDFSGLNM